MNNYLRLNKTLSPPFAARLPGFAAQAFALSPAAARRLIPIDRAPRTRDGTSRYHPNSALVLHGNFALIVGSCAINKQNDARRSSHVNDGSGPQILDLIEP
jgi:hypothetical protein